MKILKTLVIMKSIQQRINIPLSVSEMVQHKTWIILQPGCKAI